jgi:hypothetical protein
MPIPVVARSKERVCSRSLAELRVWIPLGAWMFLSCECCGLSARGLCVGLVTCPESDQVCVCVCVCARARVWVLVWVCVIATTRQREGSGPLGTVAPWKENRLPKLPQHFMCSTESIYFYDLQCTYKDIYTCTVMVWSLLKFKTVKLWKFHSTLYAIMGYDFSHAHTYTDYVGVLS